ncbi:hypothetical protein [Kinneretia aquatilis]|uniref:hypothetical protein n=1 Tax=Kinneretia aquatilis TaxID=2070761 RepID=UPI00149515E6|nr:hypothetical protein [Paucibacter aquatile]WIV99233.1 hypothetical protein K9V56_007025 [Paucibacter aquatile]
MSAFLFSKQADIDHGSLPRLAVMRAVLAFVGLSLAMIVAALFMKPFRVAPDASYPMFGVPDGDSRAYARAREESLTAKFSLQDYGVTLLLSTLMFAAFKRRPFTAPKTSLGFVALAVAAPLLTACALVFDLVQAQARWEFPPWGDSLGPALLGAPMLLMAGLAWAFGHFIWLAGVPRRAGVSLSFLAIRRSHPWLLGVVAVTALFVVGAIAEGAYWYALPGAVWLYFFASIAALRLHPNDT